MCHDITTCYLQVDAARVAHERLAQGDAPLLAADHTPLEHEPVLVDLRNQKNTSRVSKNSCSSDKVNLMVFG